MFQIAIVEDDLEQQRLLKELLLRYAQQRTRKLEIVTYQDGADLIECFARQYHVIFLDVQMSFMGGLETAAQIRRQDEQVRIVFVTNYANHAIDGYEVSANGFLVKPASYPTIARLMDRFCQELEQTPEHYLILKNSRAMQRIPLSTIYYIESMGHYVKIHKPDGDTLFLSTMREIEKQLEGQPFFRCSSGVIVGLAHVEAVDRYQVLVNGHWLTVGRDKKRGLMEAINRYASGMYP